MTISTFRPDNEVWQLNETSSQLLNQFMISRLGFDWKNYDDKEELNYFLRGWLYDNLRQPTDEVAGEGSLDDVGVITIK